jgi:hypothetical protein
MCGRSPEPRAQAGSGNAYNSFLLQPFVNYNFGEGWYVNSVPIITSNWLAKPGQQMGRPGRRRRSAIDRRTTRHSGS